jgi:hypothetical protein
VLLHVCAVVLDNVYRRPGAPFETAIAVPLLALFGVGVYSGFVRLRRVASALVFALAPCGDPAALGLLVELIRWVPAESRRELREALERSVAEFAPDGTACIAPRTTAYLAEIVWGRWRTAARFPRARKTNDPERLALGTAHVNVLAVAGRAPEYASVRKLADQRPVNEVQVGIRGSVLAVLPAWEARLRSGSAGGG